MTTVVARATRASAWPVIVGGTALTVSLAVAIIVAVALSAPVSIGFIPPLPLVIADWWWLSLVGYVLTPIVVIVCYGWDAISQRRGLRSDVNFAIVSGYARALRGMLWAAIAVGLWHILNVSVPLSELLGMS